MPRLVKDLDIETLNERVKKLERIVDILLTLHQTKAVKKNGK
jgi:ribosomal protein L17